MAAHVEQPEKMIDQSSNKFLSANGEIERLMRTLDWTKSELGSIESWPQSLRTAVRIMLDSRYAMWLGWGPNLTFLYNDAYAKMTLGPKHPWALGRPAREVWREIWSDIGPRAEAVLRTGQATWDEGLLLFLERMGFPEETYHTFSYSPVPNDQGAVGGMLCVVTEDTERTIGERRLRTLRELSARTTEETRSVEDTCHLTARILNGNPHDVPFALLYLMDPSDRRASLAAIAGMERDAPASPATVALGTELDAWSFEHVRATGAALKVSDLSHKFGVLRAGAWPESVTDALVLPLSNPGQARHAGFLVVGVSPRRPFDEGYRGFFEMLAVQVASAIGNARAYQEERKRAEALVELDRAKTTFFSNVSHEFRTPLTLMLDPLEEALKDSVSDQAPAHKERIEFAFRNSRRLLKLVNSLLDFARIEGGRIEASYEPTDLAEMTSELAGNFRSAIQQAHLTLDVDCPSLSQPVYVDREMWEKIVLNLVSNAFKFTFTGGISVSVREESHPSRVVLHVRDTGTGIPADQLEKIFERFHRVQEAKGRSIEGTGIGLTLVKQLVQLHGGTIEVASTVDQGSTFSVRLPLGSTHLPQDRVRLPRSVASPSTRAGIFVEEALRWLPPDSLGDGSVTTGEKITEQSPGTSASSLKVLVADDNADMRAYVCRLLAGRYQVTSAEDGQTALDRIMADPPDLVLADVMMPRLDGFGLLQALRKHPETMTIPVILVSARAGEESRIEGLERGADDYLIKPFSAKELLARVAAHLDLARQRKRNATLLETLLMQSPLGVYLVDADFRLAHVNPVALPVFGDVTGLVGRDFDELAHLIWEKNNADELVSIFRHTLETGEAHVATERIQRRRDNGAIESYEWRIDRILLPEERFGVVCYFRDVSVQVLAREALRRSEDRLREFAMQLEQLVAERTQELMQSQVRLRALATELNLAEQRERKRLATELHDHLQQMLVLGKLKLGQGMRLPDTASRAIEIMKQTDDVLAEALQYTRTLVAELSPPILHEQGLAAGLVWLGAQMKRHDLTVTVHVPEQEIALPEDQAVLLFQSVRELLINASKHAQSAEASIVLEQLQDNLSVQVSDHGVGFDVADAAMQQNDASRAGSSSRFGLFSIRERMKAMGGTFDIRSSRGHGTSATLSLPLVTSASRAAVTRALERESPRLKGRATVATPSPAPSEKQRIRVLLVDDHAMVREGLRSVLESYDDVDIVGEASNGQEALALVEQFRPALVVMDINMPDMNGIEATAHITKIYPETLVIGLSVNATGNNVQAMLKAGAILLLTKEAAVNELYRRMREVLTMHVGSGSAH